MLYKVVLVSESVNEILKCDHSNETATEQPRVLCEVKLSVKYSEVSSGTSCFLVSLLIGKYR